MFYEHFILLHVVFSFLLDPQPFLLQYIYIELYLYLHIDNIHIMLSIVGFIVLPYLVSSFLSFFLNSYSFPF